MDRKERNKERKRKRGLNRRRIQKETTAAASLILGIHPVTQVSVDNFYRKSGNYSKAKAAAAREYLETVLLFSSEDLEEIRITDTQMSKRGDDVMYIAVDSHETISELHRRIAERQNKEIFARNFIPPQYFARYCAMNEIGKRMRRENNEVKTQIRFGAEDVEIWTKIRGTEEPFKFTKIHEDLMRDVPQFDFSLKWNRKVEKPPRNKLSPLVGKILVPSMRSSNEKAVESSRADETPSKRLKRTSSESSEEEERNAESNGMETDASL